MNTQDNKLNEVPKPSERTTEDLLELVVQLAGRYFKYGSEELHNAYWEARNEMNKRITQLQLDNKQESAGVYTEDELKDMMLRYGCQILKGELKTPLDYEMAKDKIIKSMPSQPTTKPISDERYS